LSLPRSLHCLTAGFLLAGFGCSSTSPPSPPPESLPTLLGPKTVSVGNVFRGTFTPDGDTLYYFKNVTEGEEDYRIFRSYRALDSWSEPERSAHQSHADNDSFVVHVLRAPEEISNFRFEISDQQPTQNRTILSHLI